MKNPTSTESQTASSSSTAPAAQVDDETMLPTASVDPIVGAEVDRPVSVGVGALGAGAAGAAIGAVAGPLGVVIGAALGAMAGGLVGKEVAKISDEASIGNADSSYTIPKESASTSMRLEPATSIARGPETGTSESPTLESPANVDDGSGSISEDAIRQKAYQRYLERETSGGAGSAEEDWLAAEREVGGSGSR